MAVILLRRRGGWRFRWNHRQDIQHQHSPMRPSWVRRGAGRVIRFGLEFSNFHINAIFTDIFIPPPGSPKRSSLIHGFDDLYLHSYLHSIRWKMLNRKVSYCLPTGAEYRCRWMPTLAHSNLDTHRSSPAPGYRLSIGSRCRPMARLHPAWPIAGRTAGQCPDWGLRGGLSIYLYLLFTEVLLLIQMFGYV